MKKVYQDACKKIVADSIAAQEQKEYAEAQPQADNSDYAKCADDILKLELADEIINKHGCLVAILKRHFA